jgi:uncharacterized membrane protein YkvA (DUF1232 family)
MTGWNEAEELRRDALGKDVAKSDRLNDRERKVRRDFWAKLKAVGRHLPFVEDLVAAYYCALDPNTPTRVRAMLLAALAYFILPFDFIPDMLPVIGFADDAALLAATIATHYPGPSCRSGARPRQRTAETDLTSERGLKMRARKFSEGCSPKEERGTCSRPLERKAEEAKSTSPFDRRRYRGSCITYRGGAGLC